MASEQRVRRITCQDCGKSMKVFTDVGEATFRLEHVGHSVVIDTVSEAPVPASRAQDVVAPSVGGPKAPLEAPAHLSTRAEDSALEEPGAPTSGTKEAAPSARPTRKRQGGRGDRGSRNGEAASVPASQESSPNGEGGPTAKAAASTRELPPKAKAQVTEGTPKVVRQGDLLLARSSYIEDTDAASLEARRVSRALAEFRWSVTPPYTISMIFSDSLCITSDTGPLAKGVIEGIERIGYSFIAFEVSNGRPLAWFKRKKEPEPVEPTPTEGNAERVEELVELIRSQGAAIEEERLRLEEERKQVAQDLKRLGEQGSYLTQ